MEGYISLHRKLLESADWNEKRVWNDSEVWIYLLLKASHKSNVVKIKGEYIELKAGELCMSIKSLSEKFSWSRKKVTGYLNRKKKINKLSFKTSHLTTVITITNYCLYQGKEEVETPRKNPVVEKEETAIDKLDSSDVKEFKTYKNFSIDLIRKDEVFLRNLVAKLVGQWGFLKDKQNIYKDLDAKADLWYKIFQKEFKDPINDERHFKNSFQRYCLDWFNVNSVYDAITREKAKRNKY